MVEKWADYLISAVRYNAAETHIDRVQARADKGDTVGAPEDMPRTDVVDLLDAGTTFVTITWNAESKKWHRGAPVAIVTIDDQKYIRTDPDKTKVDNLGELPQF